MRKRVLVAMSGGIDSSVAAFLLREQGYEVVGVTMCLGVSSKQHKKPTCCGAQAIDDARKVCDKLKVSHYVIDFSQDLQKKVIKNFVSEYLKGRTPNPCVDCNRYLKFGTLIQKAIALEFDFFATGHYAKIALIKNRHVLKRPKDKSKDQTYFLYTIQKELLKSILFPLADYTKQEVRGIARSIRLPVAEKAQSQDICFIPENDYRKFLSSRVKGVSVGSVVDMDGAILGIHKGVAFYTIGQREGLGIAGGRPLYVVSIDSEKNQVVLGEKRWLKSRGLIASDMHLFVERLPRSVYAQIRYSHPQTKCSVSHKGGTIKLVFEEAQESVTPGQSVVLYKNDIVVAGGLIKEALRGYN